MIGYEVPRELSGAPARRPRPAPRTEKGQGTGWREGAGRLSSVSLLGSAPGPDLISPPKIRRQRVFQGSSVPGTEQLPKLLSVGPQGYI